MRAIGTTKDNSDAEVLYAGMSESHINPRLVTRHDTQVLCTAQFVLPYPSAFNLPIIICPPFHPAPFYLFHRHHHHIDHQIIPCNSLNTRFGPSSCFQDGRRKTVVFLEPFWRNSYLFPLPYASCESTCYSTNHERQQFSVRLASWSCCSCRG